MREFSLFHDINFNEHVYLFIYLAKYIMKCENMYFKIILKHRLPFIWTKIHNISILIEDAVRYNLLSQHPQSYLLAIVQNTESRASQTLSTIS